MTSTLKLLGGMALQDDAGPLTGQIAQRRRLALLAVLGVARSPISRDKLVGILWPELDTEGARHRLSDSVYVARRALGEHAIETVGDDIWLDDAHIAVDVRAFERALDDGALDDALARYAGPFLDGFHLSGAAEFERWVDDERARLAGRYAHALKTIAGDAEGRGDFARAAAALRQLAAVDPLDARVTLRLITALERAGDGAGALRQARVYQSLRHAELGLGEDPSVRQAADELASRLESNAASAPVAVITSNADEPRELPMTERAPRNLRGRYAAITAAIVVVVVAGWGVIRARDSNTVVRAASTASPGVAVFPFTDRGRRADDVSGEAMAILLATKLDGGAGWRSIDPNALLAQYRPADNHPDPADAARLAHRLGATYFVLGDVVRASGSVHLDAALYDAVNGEPLSPRVAAEGMTDAVFELVDSLATRLLVGRRDAPAPQLARLASLTTSSLPALKEYLAGESRARAGQYAEAAAAFERATAIDTAFALAYYRIAVVRGWGRVRDDGSSVKRAAHYASRLPERFRLTLDALSARRRGDDDGAERKLRDVIARYPDDFDANAELGDVLFHNNPPHGRDSREAREFLERAASLDPTRSAEQFFHLIAIAASARDSAGVDSLAERFLLLNPASELAVFLRPVLALARHDGRRLAQVKSDLAGLPLRGALQIAGAAAALTGQLDATATLVAGLDNPALLLSDRAALFITLAQIAGARGEWARADSLMERARQFDAPAAIDARARLLSLPIGTPPAASMRDAQRAIDGMSKPLQPRAGLLAALLAVRLGDVAGAPSLADQVGDSASDRAVGALALELSARRLLAQHKPREALAALDAAKTSGLPLRFLHAEVLEALGRNDEALRWYAVSEQDYGGELYRDAIDRARKRLIR